MVFSRQSIDLYNRWVMGNHHLPPYSEWVIIFDSPRGDARLKTRGLDRKNDGPAARGSISDRAGYWGIRGASLFVVAFRHRGVWLRRS